MSHMDSKWIFPLKYLGKSYGGICLLLFILDIKIYTITCFQYKNEGKNFLKLKKRRRKKIFKNPPHLYGTSCMTHTQLFVVQLSAKFWPN